ncbi:hypothetical protein ARMGADRAFT_1031188 [Armillaria gallica]|uniref:ATP-dependent DNA helicase n=1 Tax=Armillaria gallica TaxID=47427 RepID=A0A2H3DVK4_ARMGA|nr:hypothetical protein ARMGADRAFT_1031188 [Armillaria gallica]
MAIKAVLVYVMDYITKPGLKMHAIFDYIHAVFQHDKDRPQDPNRTRKDRTCKLMMQMVNVLGMKMEIGSPMICSYLLGFPDHYMNKKFSTFYWKSFMAEAAGKWKGLEGYADKVKVSLKRRKGTIVGVSPVEDYIHRPSELDDLTLYDWICTCKQVTNSSREAATSPDPVPFKDAMDDSGICGDAISPSVLHVSLPSCSDAGSIYNFIVEDDPEIPNEDEMASIVCDMILRAAARVPYISHETDNEDYATDKVDNAIEAPNKLKARRVAPDRDRKVPNFVGGMLPYKDKGDQEYYYLRCNANTTWDTEFGYYAVSEEHMRIMANFNLHYECLNARDDYRAQLMQDAEGDHNMINEDFTDFGIDPYSSAPQIMLGRRQKAREQQAAAIHQLVGPIGWFIAEPDMADFSNVHADAKVPPRSWNSWKEEVAMLRHTILAARQSGTVAGPVRRSNKSSSKYINQVEIITWRHLVHSLHDENEDGIINEVNKACGLNHASNPMVEQLRMYVGGMGGTGKTRVLNMVTAYFYRQGEGNRMIAVAPTGMAVALMKGSTYHYMFSINKSQCGTILKKALAEVKDRSDVPFGGMNMIFSGDFTQLPPAISGESASLYELCDGIYATSPRLQEMVMGKAIWHQITTVVILQQNMRQHMQMLDNEKLHTALANMRYKSVTKADIMFLQAKILGRHSAANITDPVFQNVSIITGLNIHKDEYNHLSAIHFAEEMGQELTMFYSDNHLSSTESDSRLWPMERSALPSANDKQIPSTLSLCKELCITKGQEGLPPNVVPIIRSASTMMCSLPDDTTGKTCPYNPVDLNNCRTHQSYYTALSRMATAEGTHLLPAIANVCASPIDPCKIQGGCSGHLHQEFHELELLNDITNWLYQGALPVTILGKTQYSLIQSFRDHIGMEYTPSLMDAKLMWSVSEPFMMEDANDLRWVKSMITHKPNIRIESSACGKKADNTALQALSPTTQSRNSVNRIITPMKGPEKHKA